MSKAKNLNKLWADLKAHYVGQEVVLLVFPKHDPMSGTVLSTCGFSTAKNVVKIFEAGREGRIAHDNTIH